MATKHNLGDTIAATGRKPAAAPPGDTAGTPTKRQSRASTLPIRGGKREVKAYALTEDELTTLGAIQGLAAFFFAVAGASLGLWLNIEQQVDFAGRQADKQVVSYWEGLQTASLIAAAVCAMIGGLLFFFNYWRVRKIKKGTVH